MPSRTLSRPQSPPHGSPEALLLFAAGSAPGKGKAPERACSSGEEHRSGRGSCAEERCRIKLGLSLYRG
eukprot:1629825-Pyramimonas_sp.AAC.1